jgi:hypothetical protein
MTEGFNALAQLALPEEPSNFGELLTDPLLPPIGTEMPSRSTTRSPSEFDYSISRRFHTVRRDPELDQYDTIAARILSSLDAYLEKLGKPTKPSFYTPIHQISGRYLLPLRGGTLY